MAYQPGGTAILTQGELTVMTMQSGHDTNRLGRWCWKLIRGKNDVRLRIVSIYFAKKPQSYGDRKAYFQQQAALLKLGIAIDPETVFGKNFGNRWMNGLLLGTN